VNNVSFPLPTVDRSAFTDLLFSTAIQPTPMNSKMPAEPKPIRWTTPPVWNEPENLRNVAVVIKPLENPSEEDVKRREEFLQDLVVSHTDDAVA
jgi:hypothetical protein